MAVGLVEKTNPGLPIWFRGQPKGDAGLRRVVAKVVEITFDSSYPTGGEAISLGAIGLSSVTAIIAPSNSGYVFRADLTDPTAPKLLAYQGDWSNVAVAPLVEVTAADSLATVVTRALIFGVT